MSVFCPNCSSKDEFGRGHYVICPKGTCPFEHFTQGTGKAYRTPSYDFVHDGLGKDLVRIHSKRQWKEELKKRGMVDDKASRMDLDKFRSRVFDAKWHQTVDRAIDQSIAEVKKKSYSTIGKQLSYSQVQDCLGRDRKIGQRNVA